jgi:hypothetical protein
MQFVAIPIGLSDDPKECLGLAHELKVERATALGYLVLWNELMLQRGDARSGRLKDYSAKHIAAKLGWTGPPRRLIDALKAAGVLTTQRQVFMHPYWRQSITGQYAIERARLRDFWRDKKAQQRAAEHQGDVPGDVPESPRDNVGTSLGTADIDQVTPPPQAGGSSGASRWGWVLKNHKRPTNPVACTRYLAALTDENWALVQWICGLPPGGGGLIPPWKKRALRLDTDRLLAKGAFLQLRPEWEEKLRTDRRTAERGKAPRQAAAPEHDLERRNSEKIARAASAAPFVLEQLADPNVPETEKEKVRARWRAAHPDVPAPWEEVPPEPVAN